MDLYTFIDFLIDNKLITGNLEGETDEAFENRLKIQKYVLIARHLGITEFNRYEYDLYIYGPYSSMLADEYYEYARGNTNTNTTITNSSNDIDNVADRFLGIVRGKDSDWLEVAGTILHLSEKYDNKDTVLSLAIDIKGHRFGAERIKQIFKELEGHGLL